MKWHLHLVVLLLAVATVAANPSFRLVGVVQEVDPEADGSSRLYATSTHSYQDGNLVESLREFDLDEDAIMDSRIVSTFLYDQKNNQTSTVTATYVISTGEIESRNVITYELDKAGNRTNVVAYGDSDADGVADSISRSILEYDDRDKLVRWTNENDSDADGRWETIQYFTRGYDERGNLILQLQETDADRDGTYDRLRRIEYTVDAKGVRLSAVDQIDSDADGMPEAILTSEYTYGSKSTLESITTQYDDGDGEIDSRSHGTFFYDRHGNLIRRVDEHDWGADGMIDSIQITTNTYAKSLRH